MLSGREYMYQGLKTWESKAAENAKEIVRKVPIKS